MMSFESLRMVFYSHSVVTMTVSGIISEIKRYIGRKSRFFKYYPLHSTAPLRGSPSEYCHKMS